MGSMVAQLCPTACRESHRWPQSRTVAPMAINAVSEVALAASLVGNTSACRAVVRGGARAAGAVADAVIDVDGAEDARRSAIGLGGVTSLGLLDALMCLPAGADVPVEDIGETALWFLRRAPVGVVIWSPDICRVRRLAVPVVAVPLVLVCTGAWRGGLRRASAFEPFAQRVLLLDRMPISWPNSAWEAAAIGVGVWARQSDGRIVELVAPAAFEQRFTKPAGWRFRERAYATWVTSKRR